MRRNRALFLTVRRAGSIQRFVKRMLKLSDKRLSVRGFGAERGNIISGLTRSLLDATGHQRLGVSALPCRESEDPPASGRDHERGFGRETPGLEVRRLDLGKSGFGERYAKSLQKC